MSEKIAGALKEIFVQLHEELASGELKKTLDAKPGEASDDEGVLYQYDIPFKDGGGKLVFEYRDNEYYLISEYVFRVVKYINLHMGFLRRDFAEEYGVDEFQTRFIRYRDDEDRGRINIATSLEGSWKRQGQKRAANIKTRALEAWELARDLDKFAKKRGLRSQGIRKTE